MDKNHSITIPAERKRGQHLGAEECGAIQQLKKLGYSNRAIAQAINCSPSAVGYELGRGTPTYSGRGRRTR
ncbi:MAG: helix-turn-helix domain-containing protein, partial [Oscillospiraceae bacterium]